MFRITHIRNLPWLLAHGLHCANSAIRDPDFVTIGNPDLIGRRTSKPVRTGPGGTMADYIPFYFTPKSPMLFNIRTGYNGITRRPNEDIIILVSSVAAMAKRGVALVFTDRHASVSTATWRDRYDAVSGLIDWTILRQHDFAREDSYPDKRERYQAEALAHHHVPACTLLGIGCCSSAVAEAVSTTVTATNRGVDIVHRPNWFFP